MHTNVAWVNLTPESSSGFLVPMMFSLVKEELVNEDLVTGESVNKEWVNDELLKEEPVIEVVTEEQVWFTLLFAACRRSHIQHTEMLVL